MTNTEELEQRVQLLEEKFEYQDQTIEALNQVIISQQGELDQLAEALENLRTQLSAMQEGEEPENEPPPPHY